MNSENNEGKGGAGRVEVHGDGLGVPAASDVELRASEIAYIHGRSPDHVTRSDRIEALRELRGRGASITEDDIESDCLANRDPKDPLYDTGHQMPEVAEPDEQANIEREVQEGLDEAQHDTMLEARREQDED